ncbi:hypothetical protein [Amycolatopsis thermoflava]|uniref:hypothetical protein n=1 Tax=Amycolatopsis thermoflava TaxID=84480 RepID=UPI00380E9DCB
MDRGRAEPAGAALKAVTDERFAKSVELLGRDADQVRVRAQHALAVSAKEVVRVAAQRLVRDLLPKRADAAPTFDLDLSGASTNRLDLSGRVVGRLLMQRAQLLHRTDFSVPSSVAASTSPPRNLAARSPSQARSSVNAPGSTACGRLTRSTSRGPSSGAA